MAQDQLPDHFDWVGAQSKCSAHLMFEQLRTRVREDVQSRNGLIGRDDRWRFEFDEDEDEDEEGFEVSRLVPSGATGTRVAALVRFERAGRRIHIHGEDIDVEFVAVVTLDTNGLCRFVVGEALYSDWEIRRMALEQLFFEESDDGE